MKKIRPFFKKLSLKKNTKFHLILFKKWDVENPVTAKTAILKKN